MEFELNNPKHLLALILVCFALFIIVIVPIISYFTIPLSLDSTSLPGSTGSSVVVELILVFVQILIVAIGIFIGIPFLWYYLVNNLSFKQMLSHIRIRKIGWELSVLWAILSTGGMFVILLLVGIIALLLGYNLENSSNITDLELYFSIPSLFIIITFQPIGEEIFFRGFLLDKFSNLANKPTAIIVTSLLFGIAHLSYNNIYPAIMTGVLGIILAYMTLKTKNLLTAITAHILFNVTSVTIYILGQSFIP